MWKKNKHFRGVVSKFSERKRRDHARKIFKRARKGARRLDGTEVVFEGCVDRFDNDIQFRERMITENQLTREDMIDYDKITQQPVASKK